MPKKVGQGQPFEHRPIEGPAKVKKSELENRAEQVASSSVLRTRASGSKVSKKVGKLGEPGQLPPGALKPSSGVPKPPSMVSLDTYQGSFAEIRSALHTLFPARADLIISSGELTRAEGAKLGLFLHNARELTELAQDLGISHEEISLLLIAIKGDEGSAKVVNGEELFRKEEVFDELKGLLAELEKPIETKRSRSPASSSPKQPKKRASRSKAAAASTTVSSTPKGVADELIRGAEQKLLAEGRSFTDTKKAREQLASDLERVSKGSIPAYLQKEIDRAGGVMPWADAKAVNYLEQYGE